MHIHKHFACMHAHVYVYICIYEHLHALEYIICMYVNKYTYFRNTYVFCIYIHTYMYICYMNAYSKIFIGRQV